MRCPCTKECTKRSATCRLECVPYQIYEVWQMERVKEKLEKIETNAGMRYEQESKAKRQHKRAMWEKGRGRRK